MADNPKTTGPDAAPVPTEAFDTYAADFEFQAGVGLTINMTCGERWLNWQETVELARWLAERVEAAKHE